jgi:hypothetical protein
LSGLFTSGFWPEVCTHFSSIPCMLHVMPLSSSLIWSSYNVQWSIQLQNDFNKKHIRKPVQCVSLLLYVTLNFLAMN